MAPKSVQEATADLSHVVANVVTVLEGDKVHCPNFMSTVEVGHYTLSKTTELRAALDELKAAQIHAEHSTEPTHHAVKTSDGKLWGCYKNGFHPAGEQEIVFSGSMVEVNCFLAGWRAAWEHENKRIDDIITECVVSSRRCRCEECQNRMADLTHDENR